MSDLKLWTDGEDVYAAESAEQAAQIRRDMMGDEGDDMGPLTLAKEPLIMIDNEETNQKEERTHSEWIDIVTQGKPGYVASTNW